MPTSPDTNLVPPSGAETVLRSPTTISPPDPSTFRAFGDATATRKNIYEGVLSAVREIEPLSDDKHTLRLTGVDWADPERFTRKQRKHAILTGETLARRLKGTWELLDNLTGKVIQSRNQVVAGVPYLSSMGTITHRGNEYTVHNQQRLRPGAYTRAKENGEIETHVNVAQGTGLSHYYFLDPDKGVFKLRMAQSEMPLLPLLRAMGATDAELKKAWGDDGRILASNYGKSDASMMKKLAGKLLRRDDQNLDELTTRQRLIDTFNKMSLDPEVTKRTLGHPVSTVDKQTILAITKKLLAVNRGEQDPDDRDHLAYQTVHGPEDLFAERIRKDHGRQRKQLFKKISFARSLDKMPSGALTPQLEHVLLGSGLSQSLEEINPAEVLDKQSLITRMGEGGIASIDSIPDEARSVQASHLGFIDPSRTPESLRVGVDAYLASGSRKGKDGRLYARFMDRSGNLVWKSPQNVADAVIATPDAMKWDTKRVPVFKAGKHSYADKSRVDYVVPEFERAFSPLANLVPFKSASKAERAAMGARYLTQALSLKYPEAPLVQSGMPGTSGRSFEEEYGPHMGAVRASRPGRVMKYADDVMTFKYDDGTTEDVELYNNHVFNRKSYIHQTPLVRPGDAFQRGQTLVKSNYTNDRGEVALGLNARVAYWPYLGHSVEDAMVVSDSFAKRASSEHAYQFGLEVSDKHKTGKRAFINLFPGAYDKRTLSRLDEHGVARPGEVVEYGQPLILAAREKDRSQNKIHKKRQPGYSDDSVLWQHHDSGVVTDVVHGKDGPVVVVKSTSSLQVGDKLSGRVGDKGVVSKILPDDQMPHGEDGKPFEVLLNISGLTTRINPTQAVEAALGKIAAKEGHVWKVPDFEDIDDLAEWAHDELRRRGMKSTETIYWPGRGTKVPEIGTGVRYLMKLHHTSEGKSQGRGGGGYTAEGLPAKGGESGCFTGDTPVDVWDHNNLRYVKVPLGDIVRNRAAEVVRTADPENVFNVKKGRVVDWFSYLVSPSCLLEVKLSDGTLLRCTPGHVFVTSSGERVCAGDLKAGDVLVSSS